MIRPNFAKTSGRASAEPGGIYFVVPFPDGWELCAFPFAHYPDVGHAFMWEHVVAPLMAVRWAPRLYPTAELDRQPNMIVLLKRKVAGLYDGAPRGRAQMRLASPRRCVVYHGNDLSAEMRMTRRKIQTQLLLSANVTWQFDTHEVRNPVSTSELHQLLGITPKTNPS